MVDATDLKSVVLSGVGVRVPPRAPLGRDCQDFLTVSRARFGRRYRIGMLLKFRNWFVSVPPGLNLLPSGFLLSNTAAAFQNFSIDV